MFVINFVPLRTQSSAPIFTWEQDYWLDCSLPLWTPFSPPGRLCLLPNPSLLYPTLWISVCSWQWRILRELITAWMCLSPFDFPLLSSWSPLSPPSPFSSLPNSVNLFVCSRWWRTLKEWITDLICLSPFDSCLYPPGHLYFLPPSSLLCITPWISLSSPDCGAQIRKWLLASLLSPLLIPPHLIRVTSNTLLPLLFSM